MTVTIDAARAVLHVEGDTNYGRCDHRFEANLIVTIKSADLAQRDKLRNEFPELVGAVEMMRRLGIESLRGIVKADLDHRDRGIDFEMWDRP